VGTQPYDSVGYVETLANGNYVVTSGNWRNGSATRAGAVTWCSGSEGCRGTISADNSLVGDAVGNNGVETLANGSYVVLSRKWTNGSAAEAGAVTWCSGSEGCRGAVSAENSLVGSQASDYVGYQTKALPGGNYVVLSPRWDNGSIKDAGAVSLGDGTKNVLVGVVNEANSVLGTAVNLGQSLRYSYNEEHEQLAVDAGGRDNRVVIVGLHPLNTVYLPLLVH